MFKFINIERKKDENSERSGIVANKGVEFSGQQLESQVEKASKVQTCATLVDIAKFCRMRNEFLVVLFSIYLQNRL